MALQAGFLNMGGLLACHRFVSHISGFGTLVPYEFETDGFSAALGMVAVPICFLLGSALSGFLVDLRLKLRRSPRYYVAFGMIWILLLLILFLGESGHFGRFGEPLSMARDYALLMVLSFTCGIQNGTITTVSKSVIRTTHLSGITTDLGIGLVRVLYRKKLEGQIVDEGKANLMRIGIIAFFMMGSWMGYEAFSEYEFRGFVIPIFTSGALFFSMVYFSLFNRSQVQ